MLGKTAVIERGVSNALGNGEGEAPGMGGAPVDAEPVSVNMPVESPPPTIRFMKAAWRASTDAIVAQSWVNAGFVNRLSTPE